MIDWPLVLIVLIAVVVLGGLLGLAAWWYLPPVDLPGQDPGLGAGAVEPILAGEFHTEQVELCAACLMDDHCDGDVWWCDCTCGLTEEWADESAEDDDWADQLHEINQLGKFGDLTRPVAHLTHYEVEALIRTLGVPEWVPGRYRMAA